MSLAENKDADLPELQLYNVAEAGIFVVLTALVSRYFSLQLEAPLLISSVRCVLQLTLLGFVLDDVLRIHNMWAVMGLTVILVLLGTYEIVFNRTRKTFNGLFPIIFVIFLVSNVLVGCLGVIFALQESPFWSPSVFVPVIGMLLGNSMSTIGLATRLCVDQVSRHAPILEARLSLGASRKEAIMPLAVETLRIAMLPSLMQLSVMGMINIPGTMAGQILAGMAIRQAVYYQQCIMFMITASSAFGAFLTIIACIMALVDHKHILRIEKIRESRPGLLRGLFAWIVWAVHRLSRPCYRRRQLQSRVE